MNKRERTNEEKKKKERKYKDKIEMKKEEGKMKGEKLGKKRNISIIKIWSTAMVRELAKTF